MNVLELTSLLFQLFHFLFWLWITVKFGAPIIEDWLK